MFFKNIIAYRVSVPFPITAAELDARLRQKIFMPCGQLDMQSSGWKSPRENDQLVHAVQGKWMLAMVTEKKILPGSVITRIAREKAKVIEDEQGFKCGRKQFKEIKETVTDELCTKALTMQQTTRVLIDTINGRIIIDTASTGRATDIMKALLQTIGNFPFWMIKTKMAPGFAMTEWLLAFEAPDSFSIDMDCELRSNTGSGTTRIKNQALDKDDLRRQIVGGKKCTQLAMTYADRVSFLLTANGLVKRITTLDILQESNQAIENEEERFDADLLIMADTFHHLMIAVTEALGGEMEPEPDAEEKQEQIEMPSPTDDELYVQAVAIVLAQKRASTSLIQRHLRIGYNRAARLLDQMESFGIIGAMQTNGSYEILVSTQEAV